MGVTVLEGQAVYIQNEFPCVESTDYGQPVMEGDCTQFQMRLTPETNIEIFSNPNLEELATDPNGWDWTLANVNNNQVILAPFGTLWQEVGLTIGRYYKLCVEITQISAGQAIVVVADGSTIFETSNSFNTVGRHCTYFYATETTETFTIASTGATGTITLTSVSLLEITIPTVALETCDGDTVTYSPQITIFRERATAVICWEGVAHGCYKICVTPNRLTTFNILDGANNIITPQGRKIVTGQQTIINGALVGSQRLTWG